MPQHKRGPWSQTEDQFLLHLVQVHGAHNWVRISSTIQTRSPKQCRERFHQNLKPNLNHDPITPEEGLMIEQMVGDMGKRWAEIARRLRGRSDNAVKNWWNGGMNRRSRSNNQRRTVLELHQQRQQQPNLEGAPRALPPPGLQTQSMPPGYSPHPILSQQYYGQPIYHHGQMPHPQHISVPVNGAPNRHSGHSLHSRHSGYSGYSGVFDTPLPSPSAFSQLSVDGAPSLVSDCSSVSGRSPYHGTSPIELPPLSGERADRRHSSTSMLRQGGSGSYAPSVDFNAPLSTSMKPPQHMLQEPFVLQSQQPPQHPQGYPPPSHFLPSQPRQPAAPLQTSLPQHFQMPNPVLRGSYPPQPLLQSSPPASLQLPGISNLSVSDDFHTRPLSLVLDPALAHAMPSVPSTPMVEGSPRDKMSLSNLTH